jgi:hypothetical protein
MRRDGWEIHTATRPLFDAAGKRCRSIVYAPRRTILIDPDVSAEELAGVVRDALAVATAVNDAAAATAARERLPAAENAKHVQGAVDFITRLYGAAGAELITKGFKPMTSDHVTWWYDAKGAGERIECHHCGHLLRDGHAMFRHLDRKHGVRRVRVGTGDLWWAEPVDGYPRGPGGECRVLIDSARRRVLYAAGMSRAEVESILSRSQAPPDARRKAV